MSGHMLPTVTLNSNRRDDVISHIATVHPIYASLLPRAHYTVQLRFCLYDVWEKLKKKDGFDFIFLGGFGSASYICIIAYVFVVVYRCI
jgi:hypothetical protein